MLIILTGGTGLIGKALGPRLVTAGYRIHLLTRSPEKARKTISYPCDIFSWNALSDSFPKEALPSRNEDWGVIHLAGENIFKWPWTRSFKKAVRQSRVQGTSALVRCVSQCNFPPKFFISAGAVGVYGEQETGVARKGMEDHAVLENKNAESFLQKNPETLFLQKVCVDWERSALSAKRFSRTVVFRLGHVLSTDGGFLKNQVSLVNWKVYGFLKSKKPHWISWIHEEDLTGLFLWAMDNKDVEGIYNAVAPEPVTLREFSEMLCRNLNFKPWIPPLPMSLLKFLGGEPAKNILISCKVFPEKAQRRGYIFQYSNIGVALTHLLCKQKNR